LLFPGTLIEKYLESAYYARWIGEKTMGLIGWQEALLFAVVVILIFGAKRLPEIGKSLGSGLREFKKSISGEAESEALEDKSGQSQSSTPASAAESSQAEEK
jgi:sec-independent protein translocase protein TatA